MLFLIKNELPEYQLQEKNNKLIELQMDDQEEFERQLALEQEETRKQEQGYIYTDPNDGTVYEWDDEKQAWFPRVDEDFLAAYHANYGINPSQSNDSTTSTDTTTTNTTTTSASETSFKIPSLPPKPKPQPAKASSSMSVEESLLRAQREAEEGIPAPVLDEKLAAADALKAGKRKKEEPTWFDMEESRNTNVYVSGLPTENFTEKEFVELMSKCGIIMMDEEKNEPKAKLYRDVEGNLKGDGRCCYLKVESVRLSIELLDDSTYEGKKIHVERAQFTMKGNFNPQLKKKKKKPNKKKKGQKNFNQQEKLLDWRPEKALKKKRFEQVVILKHVFHPSEFEEDAMLINEIKDDLEAECSKYGEVKKVMIFDRHPDGVASVKFKDGDGADVCVMALNGRWFAKRQLHAEIWDGKTDYKVEETDKERDERLKKWQDFLEDDEAEKKTDESKPEEEGQTTSNEDGGDGEKKTESKPEEEGQTTSNEDGGDGEKKTDENKPEEEVTTEGQTTSNEESEKTVAMDTAVAMETGGGEEKRSKGGDDKTDNTPGVPQTIDDVKTDERTGSIDLKTENTEANSDDKSTEQSSSSS